MVQETRSAQVNLRLPPSLKEAADKAAADDHRSLASLIEKLLSHHLRTRPTLEEWHERALARFAAGIAEKESDKAKLGILARSYAINTENGDRLDPARLARDLRSVDDALRTAITPDDLFYVYQNNPDLLPYFTSDSTIFRKSMDEILEFLSIDTRNRVGFWRVSSAGMATQIATHVEDRPNDVTARCGLYPGKWLSPYQLTRNLAELVLHAGEFSQKLPSATTVEFRTEWSGLRERRIAEPNALDDDPGGISRIDSRTTIGEWPIIELRRSWPEIVSALGGPILRLFDNHCEYSPEFIRQRYLPRLKG